MLLGFTLIYLLCFGVDVAELESKDEFGRLVLQVCAFCMDLSPDCEPACSTCAGVVTQPAEYYIVTWLLSNELLQTLLLWLYCCYKTTMKHLFKFWQI